MATAALQQSAQAIRLIPESVQVLVSNAISDAIRNWRNEEASEGKEIRRSANWTGYISKDLWHNRDLVLSWASSGGYYRLSDFPIEYSDDEELFLLFAQHDARTFDYASTELCSNIEFMRKAIEINGEVFLYLYPEDMKYDFDLATIAFSHSGAHFFLDHHHYDDERNFCLGDVVTFSDYVNEADIQFMQRYIEYIEMKIRDYNNFLQILKMVSILRVKGEGESFNHTCPIMVLNQGNETMTELMKLIYEYVGLPTGIELQRMQSAYTNIVIKEAERRELSTFYCMTKDDDDDDYDDSYLYYEYYEMMI
jgi:hypothetical protein